jgi:hypothetical protein
MYTFISKVFKKIYVRDIPVVKFPIGCQYVPVLSAINVIALYISLKTQFVKSVVVLLLERNFADGRENVTNVIVWVRLLISPSIAPDPEYVPLNKYDGAPKKDAISLLLTINVALPNVPLPAVAVNVEP